MREPNGPGDVISWVKATDVDMCIEVKASPSVDEGQVVLYGKDIRTLLEFLECRDKANPGSQACAFFVLLDKSSDYFGQWESSSPQADRKVQWDPCNTLGELIPQGFETKGAREARDKLNKDNKCIRLSCTPPEHAPFVEVIRLGEPDRRFAWRS